MAGPSLSMINPSDSLSSKHARFSLIFINSGKDSWSVAHSTTHRASAGRRHLRSSRGAADSTAPPLAVVLRARQRPRKAIARISSKTGYILCPKKMNQLSISNLRVSIAEQEIIRGLSLAVPKGEMHAIMGPNGSGKSTLAKVLAGHPDYKVTTGEVLMDGEDILALAPDERARKGLFLAVPISERNPGRDHREFSARGGAGPLARGRGTRGDRLLREALRKNGPARNGSLVHLALGQRRFLRRRKEAERNSAAGDAGTEIRRARRNRQRPRYRRA